MSGKSLKRKYERKQVFRIGSATIDEHGTRRGTIFVSGKPVGKIEWKSGEKKPAVLEWSDLLGEQALNACTQSYVDIPCGKCNGCLFKGECVAPIAPTPNAVLAIELDLGVIASAIRAGKTAYCDNCGLLHVVDGKADASGFVYKRKPTAAEFLATQ